MIDDDSLGKGRFPVCIYFSLTFGNTVGLQQNVFYLLINNITVLEFFYYINYYSYYSGHKKYDECFWKDGWALDTFVRG